MHISDCRQNAGWDDSWPVFLCPAGSDKKVGTRIKPGGSDLFSFLQSNNNTGVHCSFPEIAILGKTSIYASSGAKMGFLQPPEKPGFLMSPNPSADAGCGEMNSLLD